MRGRRLAALALAAVAAGCVVARRPAWPRQAPASAPLGALSPGDVLAAAAETLGDAGLGGDRVGEGVASRWEVLDDDGWIYRVRVVVRVEAGALVAEPECRGPEDTACDGTPPAAADLARAALHATLLAARVHRDQGDAPGAAGGWWCAASHDAVLGASTCVRSGTDCARLAAGMRREGFAWGGCVPQARAACLTYDRRLAGGTDTVCLAEFADCRAAAAYLRARVEDYRITSDCTATE